MRIGIFTDTYLPDTNGCAQSATILANNLIKLGHEVIVVCSGNELREVKEGNIVRIPGIEAKKLYGYKVSSPIHLQFLEEAYEFDFDIIHAETEFGIGILANLVAHALKVPLVRTYHTDYVDYTSYFIPEEFRLLRFGAREFASSITRVYGDDCLRLMTPSEKTKEMLLSCNIKTPIDVIPNGIELDKFDMKNTSIEKRNEIRKEFKVKENEKLLVYIGRIADEKRVDLLLRAFQEIKKKKLQVKLGVVGHGTAYNKVLKMNEEFDLSDYVVFVGKKDPSEVPSYYASADGFISASTSETQGLTYIEALASRLPVIVAYDEVLKGLVEEGVNGFFFNDETTCVKAIEKFCNLDIKSLNEMKKKAIDSTQIYSAKKFAKDTLKIYEEVVEEYKNSYHVIKTSLKENTVVLKLKNRMDEEVKLSLTLDDYMECGLRKDSIVSEKKINELKKKEKTVLAYIGAIRRLAIKDYSILQMRRSLFQKYELSKEELDQTIKQLLDKNLLNDEKYCLNRIQLLENAGFSKRRIFEKLKKDGISEELIKKYYVEDNDNEIIKARRKAEKYKNSIHGKSLEYKKKTILARLINDGYSLDLSKDVVNDLDLSMDVLLEDELLKIEAEKAYLKYRKKCEGYELRNKIFIYLVSRGFKQEAVYTVINEMEF